MRKESWHKRSFQGCKVQHANARISSSRAQGSKNSANLGPSNAKTLDALSLATLELSNLTFQLCNLNRGTVEPMVFQDCFQRLQSSKVGFIVPKRPGVQHSKNSDVPGSQVSSGFSPTAGGFGVSAKRGPGANPLQNKMGIDIVQG